MNNRPLGTHVHMWRQSQQSLVRSVWSSKSCTNTQYTICISCTPIGTPC